MDCVDFPGPDRLRPREEAALKWPALKALDHEVEELDGLLAGEPDPAALAEHLPHVREALDAVLEGGVPPDAANPELVERKLEELRALAGDLDDDPDTLRALHPLVASAMEEAGMPHVHDEHDHDHDHGHDHEHGDHDHEH
jgi:hypothetical protein